MSSALAQQTGHRAHPRQRDHHDPGQVQDGRALPQAGSPQQRFSGPSLGAHFQSYKEEFEQKLTNPFPLLPPPPVVTYLWPQGVSLISTYTHITLLSCKRYTLTSVPLVFPCAFDYTKQPRKTYCTIRECATQPVPHWPPPPLLLLQVAAWVGLCVASVKTLNYLRRRPRRAWSFSLKVQCNFRLFSGGQQPFFCSTNLKAGWSSHFPAHRPIILAFFASNLAALTHSIFKIFPGSLTKSRLNYSLSFTIFEILYLRNKV